MPHAPCPMPHAPCPMPHAPCPMPHAPQVAPSRARYPAVQPSTSDACPPFSGASRVLSSPSTLSIPFPHALSIPFPHALSIPFPHALSIPFPHAPPFPYVLPSPLMLSPSPCPQVTPSRARYPAVQPSTSA
ncbi:unnamed protein product [Closterium sp. NIES-53]